MPEDTAIEALPAWLRCHANAMQSEVGLEQILDLVTRSVSLMQDNRREEALACLDDALRANARFLPALVSRGLVLTQLGRYEDALQDFDHFLAHAPASPEVGHLRRIAVQGALDRYDEVIALEKPDAETFFRRGNLYLRLQEAALALADYECVLALAPDHEGALNNRGNALLALNRHEEALIAYARVLDRQPDDVLALFNFGNVLQQLGHFDEALAAYDRAQALQPDFAEAGIERSHCLLARGDYAAGWPLYEWRWKTPQLASHTFRSDSPLWLGDAPLQSRTILLWAEQGLGDTIQFARYARLVADEAGETGTVFLRVSPALKALMQGLDERVRVIDDSEPVPAHDCHCPLMSLPLAFDTQLATIPLRIPYLHAEPTRIAYWAEKLGARAKPRIGLVWAGRQMGVRNLTRDLPLAQLRALDELDLELFALQRDIPPDDVGIVQAWPKLNLLGDALHDFTDTAAVLANLDLLISVDTAVAHLAGAMGVPCWLLLRHSGEWRWLREREDSPWYPSLRLFRQPTPGDWAGVTQALVQTLRTAV